jgi:hypothetical protein
MHAQKNEKRETKKVLKIKGASGAGAHAHGSNAKPSKPKRKKLDDSDTDGDDLEGILESVSYLFRLVVSGLGMKIRPVPVLDLLVDAERMGRSAYGY